MEGGEAGRLLKVGVSSMQSPALHLVSARQSQESYLGWLRGTDPKGPAGRGGEPRPCGIPRLWCRAEAKAEVAGRLGVPSRTGKATWGPELGECVVLEMR